MNNNAILRVENLKISFRTINGKVQAVRNVSFNLNKGETLAVVGESGSGKSVTTRAAMGILAKNAIVESGQIIYDGKDILKLSEWELHKLRGEKISMIFQDPLSSLNPITKIGKQLIEAPVLKAKSNRKENRILFKETINVIKETINNAPLELSEKENKKALLNTYLSLQKIIVEEELPYEYAYDFLKESLSEIDDCLFAINHDLDKDLLLPIKEIITLTKKSFHKDLLLKDKEILSLIWSMRKKLYPLIIKQRFKKASKNQFNVFKEDLSLLKVKIEATLKKEKPDFFLRALEISKVDTNKDKLKDGLMDLIMLSMEYANQKSVKSLQKDLAFFETKSSLFTSEVLKKQEINAFFKESSSLVKSTINPLELDKDFLSYIYKDSLKKAIQNYFKTLKLNAKEEKRFEKETKKWNSLKEKGKEPSFKIVPKNIVEESILRSDITKIINKVVESYKVRVTKKVLLDEASKILTSLSKTARDAKRKHTSLMAKIVALKLMKEVGIPEPHKRFYQYPFEFSGGMRQRIVIAIALTANPEILICDEPTTALDVTIQAQILELINRIKEERKLSVIFITHNLGVVANMADRIAVMYAGQIVEYGTYNDIFYDPKHPYTWALLSSMPDLDTKDKLDAIPGTPPNMIYPPVGDAFAPRNKYALKIDFRREPPMFMVTPTHFAKTWLLADGAPKVTPPPSVVRRIARMEKKYGEMIDKEMSLEIKEKPDEAFIEGSQKASKEKAERLNPLAKEKKGDTKNE